MMIWKRNGGNNAKRIFICLCAVLAGLHLRYVVKAQQTDRVPPAATPPKAVWTPTAEAPKGALSTALEGQHHDLFIDLAKKGDINLVFFGTTETEMWWWPDRGRSVWDREFGSLHAANFGSQGTQPDSLLWRMRNGELDGYQAKLVVWQTWGPNATPATGASAIYGPIIAEIRARQPQARILLMAPLPRGQWDRDEWRKISADYAATFGGIVDNTTVFYTDISERFYLSDGSHNQDMWRFPPKSGLENVGTQKSAYEVWAKELQPWLDRFVR